MQNVVTIWEMHVSMQLIGGGGIIAEKDGDRGGGVDCQELIDRRSGADHVRQFPLVFHHTINTWLPLHRLHLEWHGSGLCSARFSMAFPLSTIAQACAYNFQHLTFMERRGEEEEEEEEDVHFPSAITL